jgi:EAL domain-containing protein (putative c-di-GMP-specific phosphodiesterase class I)
LVGWEALIRWQHPERGLLSPDQFIPLAEESQLILPIGKWVLEQACRQAVLWHSLRPGRPPLKMAVNVSPQQLARSDLAQTIAAVLEETGMDPASLCLEITESVLMADAEFYVKALLDLKRLGVAIAIDDFGMGYSSLAYLQQFPVDILKIDMAFVSRLGQGKRQSSAIVAAIIDLAHALDLTTVAEGVENEKELRDLEDLGCDVGQGYYFGRPQPENLAAELLGATWSSNAAPAA